MKNAIHLIGSKNEWLLLLASFTTKFELVFALTLENDFSLRFHFKANRKSLGSSKNSPPFERSACFCVTINENFKHFQYFSFETDYLVNENFFKKLEYRFLVESTEIEYASFTYKTYISKANVTTNRMMGAK